MRGNLYLVKSGYLISILNVRIGLFYVKTIELSVETTKYCFAMRTQYNCLRNQIRKILIIKI